MRHSVTSLPRDPAEPWEMPYTPAEGGSFFRARRASIPYTPRRAEDIPAGCLESLREVCGIRVLGQVLVIPRAVRSTGWRGELVIAPNSVLALGDRAVGLWTEKPEPGIRAAIQLADLAAIEDMIVLLYGRLSFVSASARLTVRYNTVARQEMEPALLELRRRLAGPQQDVPVEAAGRELPFKWKVLVSDPRVRLVEGSPVVFSFASVPGRSRRDPSNGQLVALNPFELVYLREPFESSGRYGVDSVVVPRSRVTEVREQPDGLAISSNGATIALSMAPLLRGAALRWAGPERAAQP